MITLSINGLPVTVEKDTTIYQAAKTLGIKIPTLCHFELDCFHVEHRIGSCRVCVVEVEGRRNLAPACCTPVTEGMIVSTNSVRAIHARRTVLDLILSDHPKECLTCPVNGDCELQALAGDLKLTKVTYEGEMSHYPTDVSSESIIRDLDKCIMCRRCETACNDMQTVGILSGVRRGFEVVVAPTMEKPLSETKCVFCGQCVAACPVGALTTVVRVDDVWAALNDERKTVVVQTAPAVRVALGEGFGMEPGTISTGKMVAALRRLGFNAVFDTDFAADLTVLEETTEFISRLRENRNLPILTSCCPGWVKFFEHQFPDLMYMPSSAKSPQQMFGVVAKTYYARKIGVAPEDLVVVSVMPCLSKKYEASRSEFGRDGYRDVDIVISTRELIYMLDEAGLCFDQLEEDSFDDPLGESTGAGLIFGASGGVCEAALRTAADWLTGTSLDAIDFAGVRGLEGTKEATVTIGDMELRAAVVSGLGNARALLNRIRKGEVDYHIIEIMACPGGCLNGGGQPFIHGNTEILEKRMEAIYQADAGLPKRKSHENTSVLKLYEDFLGQPGSEQAHEFLHTKYTPRAND